MRTATRARASAGLIAAALVSGCGGPIGGGPAGGGHAAHGAAGGPVPRSAASAGLQAVRPPRGASPAARPAVAAGQAITVAAASYGATYTALSAYQRVGGKWHRVFGPWTARIGNAGMAPPGRKREGDGRTPSGTYALGFGFGALPDPGVALGYRQAHPYDVWDDDPSSPLYNEWVDDRYHDPGANPEPMDVSGYDYGVVIAYNTLRTPGLGSAIFLHVAIGTATTGCITLPPWQLLRVLRWLRPAQSPRIVMGVGRLPLPP